IIALNALLKFKADFNRVPVGGRTRFLNIKRYIGTGTVLLIIIIYSVTIILATYIVPYIINRNVYARVCRTFPVYHPFICRNVIYVIRVTDTGITQQRIRTVCSLLCAQQTIILFCICRSKCIMSTGGKCYVIIRQARHNKSFKSFPSNTLLCKFKIFYPFSLEFSYVTVVEQFCTVCFISIRLFLFLEVKLQCIVDILNS